MDIRKLFMYGSSFSVLRNIQKTEIFQYIYDVLKSYDKTVVDFYSSFGMLSGYILENGSFGTLFRNELIYDENIYARNSVDFDYAKINQDLKNAVDFDLLGINELCKLTSEDFIDKAIDTFVDDIEFIKSLPKFKANMDLDINNSLDLFNIYKKNGFGYFAKGKAFCIENSKVVLVENPDKVSLFDLKGYERQKASIIANTTAFLDGMESNNILLYGDKGTGKSSTVKAIVNEFANCGLKIIQMKINQINCFQTICQKALSSPFKFIVFLDDLSLNQEDESFGELKAFIEGGITGKPYNVLIYATSNRRHLVRESFVDRNTSNEVHLRDTMETITSLSDRFGLEITFSVPGKDEYLDIVDRLAEELELDIDELELHMLAERFALKRNGRSPRTARQFIYYQNSLRNAKQV